MSSKGIRAGKAFVELFADDKKLVRGLKSAQYKLRKFGSMVSGLGSAMAGVGTAIVGPLIAASKVFAGMGDSLAKMSGRTGVSVESLSQLGFAAEQSGADLATLEKGIRTMQRSINDAGRGLSTATDALAALGLTYKALEGLSPEQQFKAIADRISGIEDPSKRAALAMQLLGRAGTGLLPMMKNGAQGIEQLQDEARKLGLTISTEDANAAAKFTDRLNVLWKVVKQGVFAVGSALAPALTDAAHGLLANVQAATAWVKANRGLIVGAAKTAAKVAAVGFALLAVGKVVGSLSAILGGLAGAVRGLTGAFKFLMAHPVVAGFAAITAAVVGSVIVLKSLASHTARLSNTMSDALKKGDEQRRADKLRIQRLGQLAEKEALNNSEMKEASDLIDTLQGRYGDMGIEIDKAAGKIEGFTAAQKKLSAAMKDAALSQVTGAIAEQGANIAELQYSINAEVDNPWNVWGPDKGKIEVLHAKIAAAVTKIEGLEKRRAALLAGDEKAVTGDAQGAETAKLQQRIAAGVTDVKKALEAAADAEKRLADIAEQRAAKRRSQVAQEIHDIRQLAAEEKKHLQTLLAAEQKREGGPRLSKLFAMQEQLQSVDPMMNADVQAVRDRDEAQRQRAEQERREQREAIERDKGQSLADQIARLKVRAGKDGLAEDLGLLELDRKSALGEVGGNKELAALTNEKFDLQRAEMIEKAKGGIEAAEQSVKGTFSGEYASRLGHAGDASNKRTAEATENTAEATMQAAELLDKIFNELLAGGSFV